MSELTRRQFLAQSGGATAFYLLQLLPSFAQLTASDEEVIQRIRDAIWKYEAQPSEYSGKDSLLKNLSSELSDKILQMNPGNIGNSLTVGEIVSKDELVSRAVIIKDSELKASVRVYKQGGISNISVVDFIPESKHDEVYTIRVEGSDGRVSVFDGTKGNNRIKYSSERGQIVLLYQQFTQYNFIKLLNYLNRIN